MTAHHRNEETDVNAGCNQEAADGKGPHALCNVEKAAYTSPSGESDSSAGDIRVVQRALRRTTRSASPMSTPRSRSPDALRNRCKQMRREEAGEDLVSLDPEMSVATAAQGSRRPSVITSLSGFKDWQMAKREASPDVCRHPKRTSTPTSNMQEVPVPKSPLPSSDPFRRTASDPGVKAPASSLAPRPRIIIRHGRRLAVQRPVQSKWNSSFDRPSSNGSNRSDSSNESDAQKVDRASSTGSSRSAASNESDAQKVDFHPNKASKLRASVSLMGKMQIKLNALKSGGIDAVRDSLWKPGRHARPHEVASGAREFSRTAPVPALTNFLRTSSYPGPRQTLEACSQMDVVARDAEGASGHIGLLAGEQIFVCMAIGDWQRALRKLAYLRELDADDRQSALSFEDADGNSLMHAAVMATDEDNMQDRSNPSHGDEVFSPKTMCQASGASSLGGLIGAMERKQVRMELDADQVDAPVYSRFFGICPRPVPFVPMSLVSMPDFWRGH